MKKESKSTFASNHMLQKLFELELRPNSAMMYNSIRIIINRRYFFALSSAGETEEESEERVLRPKKVCKPHQKCLRCGVRGVFDETDESVK